MPICMKTSRHFPDSLNFLATLQLVDTLLSLHPESFKKEKATYVLPKTMGYYYGQFVKGDEVLVSCSNWLNF